MAAYAESDALYELRAERILDSYPMCQGTTRCTTMQRGTELMTVEMSKGVDLEIGLLAHLLKSLHEICSHGDA